MLPVWKTLCSHWISLRQPSVLRVCQVSSRPIICFVITKKALMIPLPPFFHKKGVFSPFHCGLSPRANDWQQQAAGPWFKLPETLADGNPLLLVAPAHLQAFFVLFVFSSSSPSSGFCVKFEVYSDKTDCVPILCAFFFFLVTFSNSSDNSI